MRVPTMPTCRVGTIKTCMLRRTRRWPTRCCSCTTTAFPSSGRQITTRQQHSTPGARLRVHSGIVGTSGECSSCGRVVCRLNMPLCSRYSQFFLATEEEKRYMNELWQNEWTLKVWQSRRPCRDTRSLKAGDMLTAMFAQWTPPYGFMEIPQTPWT